VSVPIFSRELFHGMAPCACFPDRRIGVSVRRRARRAGRVLLLLILGFGFQGCGPAFASDHHHQRSGDPAKSHSETDLASAHAGGIHEADDCCQHADDLQRDEHLCRVDASTNLNRLPPAPDLIVEGFSVPQRPGVTAAVDPVTANGPTSRIYLTTLRLRI
jgi:hypothetical protein